MIGFEMRCTQAKEFRDVIRLLDACCSAPLHEVISAAVSRGPSLTLELFQIAFSDWTDFRLESQAEIDSMLLLAIERRAA